VKQQLLFLLVSAVELSHRYLERARERERQRREREEREWREREERRGEAGEVGSKKERLEIGKNYILIPIQAAQETTTSTKKLFEVRQALETEKKERASLKAKVATLRKVNAANLQTYNIHID
jgi:hypothetical protein